MSEGFVNDNNTKMTQVKVKLMTGHSETNIKTAYLLLTEFKVRTISNRPSFFPLIYGPSAKPVGHKSQGEKTRIRNLQYGPRKRG